MIIIMIMIILIIRQLNNNDNNENNDNNANRTYKRGSVNFGMLEFGDRADMLDALCIYIYIYSDNDII